MSQPNDIVFKWRGLYVDIMRDDTTGRWSVLVGNRQMAHGLVSKMVAVSRFCDWANQQRGEVVLPVDGQTWQPYEDRLPARLDA